MPKVTGSGRKCSVEWSEVIRIEGERGSKVKCKYCEGQVSSKIERIRNHMKKCRERVRKVAEDAILNAPDYLDVCIESEGSCKELASYSSDSETPSSPVFLPTLQTQQTTTDGQKRHLDRTVARMFYSNCIPFSVASSSHFINMVQALRPGYAPPTRRDLQDSLLSEASHDLERRIREFLRQEECSSVVLVQNGWSSPDSDPIISTVHLGPLRKNYLMSTTDCGSQQTKTEDFCGEVASDAIRQVTDRYSCEVFAVCADMDDRLSGVKQILREKHPSVLAYTCSALYVNLVEEEVTSGSLIGDVTRVVDHFGDLTAKRSRIECLKTFVRNFKRYRDSDDLDDDVAGILNRSGVQRESEVLLRQLSDIASVKEVLQSNDANFSSAVEVWHQLVFSPSLQPFRSVIEKRRDESIEAFFFVAYLMDPFREGTAVGETERGLAESWLTEHRPDFLGGFLAFRIRDSAVFPRIMFHDSVLTLYRGRPGVWWQLMGKMMKGGLLPDDFCRFFSGLLSCPPSCSASGERVFAWLRREWPRLSAALGSEAASKLVGLYKYHQDAEPDW